MTNVFDIGHVREEKDRARHARSTRRKIETVRRLVQCTSCRFRCAMCGDRSEDDVPETASGSEFTLCAGCREEYEAFLALSDGKDASDAFWHNEAWYALWGAWADYQRAIKAFKNSKEFREIIAQLFS